MLDFGDPLDAAHSHARTMFPRGPSELPEPTHTWGADDYAEVLAALPAGLHDTVIDELSGIAMDPDAEVVSEMGGDVCGEPGPASLAEGPKGFDAPDDEAALETLALEAATASGALGDAEEAPTVAALPATLDEMVASAIVDPAGFVYSAHEPFLRGGQACGRITTWPDSKPEEKRSVSLKCNQHKKCAAIGMRRVCDNHLLLRWLFAAEVPGEDAGAETWEAARDKPVQLWKDSKPSTKAKP